MKRSQELDPHLRSKLPERGHYIRTPKAPQ